ncbi:LmbE family N-acetylglucosaminyl deacetylase [Phycicoccus badiiscoriae]|uniref:LmbE family N-acetylglucosaminyl deacetylase n=1 Tax=Pedococcus badiiscoriae TaxID=642776 RepID=A0A852WKU7_9MICO|nr:LmbE family N-acetylglucosaminyl deacetylase [Pedococcus badiiscoriae]
MAPHPDDETLGCGARLAMARAAGVEAHVVVLSRGEAGQDSEGGHGSLPELRARELGEAMRTLGVPPDHLLQWDFPDGSLSSFTEEIAVRLAGLIDEAAPDDVYVTCVQESHPDHAAAAEATRLALARTSCRPRLLEYPIWLWTDWPLSRRHARGAKGLRELLRMLAERTAEAVDTASVGSAKEAALAAYRSQHGDEKGQRGLPESILRDAARPRELAFVTTDRVARR